jgi:hypothetical protein
MRVGRVYKIVTRESNQCYVGSTFSTLRERWRGHKKDYNQYLRGNRGCVTSFDLFDAYGIEQCKILLVKEYDVLDREHLDVFENLWINKLQCINQLNPCGKIVECLVRKERSRRWYEDNKEYALQQKKEWYKANKEYARQQRKKWHEDNKEHANQKKREWHHAHREQVKENKKGFCDVCEKDYAYLEQHYKTIKHRDAVEKLNQ